MQRQNQMLTSPSKLSLYSSFRQGSLIQNEQQDSIKIKEIEAVH